MLQSPMAKFSRCQCLTCQSIAVYPSCSNDGVIGRCQCGSPRLNVVEDGVDFDDTSLEILHNYIESMNYHAMTERDIEFDELWDDYNEPYKHEKEEVLNE